MPFHNPLADAQRGMFAFCFTLHLFSLAVFSFNIFSPFFLFSFFFCLSSFLFLSLSFLFLFFILFLLPFSVLSLLSQPFFLIPHLFCFSRSHGGKSSSLVIAPANIPPFLPLLFRRAHTWLGLMAARGRPCMATTSDRDPRCTARYRGPRGHEQRCRSTW